MKRFIFLFFILFLCCLCFCANAETEKHPSDLQGTRMLYSDCNWGIRDGVLWVWPTNGVRGEFRYGGATMDTWPWLSNDRLNIRKCVIEEGVYCDRSSSFNYMFYNCSNLESVVFPDSFNTIDIVSMAHVFSGCSSLKTIVFGNSFRTDNVTDFGSMFCNCSSLDFLDLSFFNTSSALKMDWMFSGCRSLLRLNILSFDTSHVTNMSYMFQYCYALVSLDVSNFDVSSVTNMRSLFSGCSKLTNLDLSGWNTSNVTSMSYMFSNCSKLTSLDVSNFDMRQTIDVSFMFYGSGLYRLQFGENCCFSCENVNGVNFVDLPGYHWCKEGVPGYYSMRELADVYVGESVAGVYLRDDACAILYDNGDLVFQWGKYFDTERGSVYKVYDANIDNLNASNCTYIPWYNDRLLVNRVIFKDVVRPKSASWWFYEMKNLVAIENLYKLDLSQVSGLSSFIVYCDSLQYVDLTGLDMSSLTSLHSLFSYCRNLSVIDGLSCFETGHFVSFGYVFNGCYSLRSLDLSFLDTREVVGSGSRSVFGSCYSLKEVVLGENFRFTGKNLSSLEWMLLPTPS